MVFYAAFRSGAPPVSQEAFQYIKTYYVLSFCLVDVNMLLNTLILDPASLFYIVSFLSTERGSQMFE